jgi:hypothetical protein
MTVAEGARTIAGVWKGPVLDRNVRQELWARKIEPIYFYNFAAIFES